VTRRRRKIPQNFLAGLGGLGLGVSAFRSTVDDRSFTELFINYFSPETQLRAYPGISIGSEVPL
jgi:hypothetical protein